MEEGGKERERRESGERDGGEVGGRERSERVEGGLEEGRKGMESEISEGD